MTIYNSDWYVSVVAPESKVYDDGQNYFRYVDNPAEASGVYGYGGLRGDWRVVREALGKPLFVRHTLDHDGPGWNRHTRVIPCYEPWLPGSPHLAEAERARNLGIVAECHGSQKHALEEFRINYLETMQRKDADDKYSAIAERLALWADNEQVMVVTAPGAGALFLLDGTWAHYHMSYRHLGAHNTAMHAIFDLAVPLISATGCQHIHLGGGMSGQLDDPLYKFKARIGRMSWQIYQQEIP